MTATSSATEIAAVTPAADPTIQASVLSHPERALLPDLPRKVGFWGAMAVMIGIVIGSGIFATPTIIARNLDSAPLILAFWVVGGLIALFGALAFAELAALLPHSGGIYVFLREGIGPCPA